MRIFVLSFLVWVFSLGVNAQPPLSAYGELPNVDRMAISPDGKHLAYILREGDNEGLFIFNIENGEISGGAKVEKGKVRRIGFAGPDHVILHASVTTRGYGGKFEDSGAGSYNIKTNKLINLLWNAPALRPQTGLGRIIAYNPAENEVYMPAFAGEGSQTWYEVYRVNLDTNQARQLHKAGDDVIDWIVDSNGDVVAREDFSRYEKLYLIKDKQGGQWRTIYSEITETPSFFISGVKPDRSGLVAYLYPENRGLSSVFEISFDGERSEPIFIRQGADIEDILMDINRTVIGVEYSGFYSGYEFYDSGLTKIVADAAAKFPGASVSLMSWTDDFQKLLFLAEGARRAPAYYLYDNEKRSLAFIAKKYDKIGNKDVGDIFTIEYKARDGLTIPAIVTVPPLAEKIENLPMIVLPHGGPESYDGVGFNWMAQYFASRGYLVFQPNFRGSGGFGAEFRNAGHGEWGGKMQDDITDGVEALIRNGWVDKDRICIIGASYGGYAALAGGAFTPDLYKCVAAIAPVSDVKKILKEVKREQGSRSFAFEYWEKLIGDLGDDSARLDAISPVNHAANFTAPVLLIHGKNDTVVSILHSRWMRSKLKQAGRDVTLVELPGEDHWLSQSETRLRTLEELDKFINASIGAR